MLDLRRALNVDVENDIVSLFNVLLDKCASRSIKLTIELRPLQEIAMIDHLHERSSVREKVVDTFSFSLARKSSCVRNREPQILETFK